MRLWITFFECTFRKYFKGVKSTHVVIWPKYFNINDTVKLTTIKVPFKVRPSLNE